ncbi:hypothetical protein BZG36_00444 [Bifiguratus adelaidae]|uniref:Oxidation resistance protein 1 n=1 Tax=Bifiguratus adelaidae TaxID=1938954 RepID=A0A261Y7T2_9FUNG|nr:hypothetical protein BZG36_00444 [Bifiguratus adelaidae]
MLRRLSHSINSLRSPPQEGERSETPPAGVEEAEIRGAFGNARSQVTWQSQKAPPANVSAGSDIKVSRRATMKDSLPASPPQSPVHFYTFGSSEAIQFMRHTNNGCNGNVQTATPPQSPTSNAHMEDAGKKAHRSESFSTSLPSITRRATLPNLNGSFATPKDLPSTSLNIANVEWADWTFPPRDEENHKVLPLSRQESFHSTTSLSTALSNSVDSLDIGDASGPVPMRPRRNSLSSFHLISSLPTNMTTISEDRIAVFEGDWSVPEYGEEDASDESTLAEEPGFPFSMNSLPELTPSMKPGMDNEQDHLVHFLSHRLHRDTLAKLDRGLWFGKSHEYAGTALEAEKGDAVKLVGSHEETLLSPSLAEELNRHLPFRHRLSHRWNLVYSTAQHGISLGTLYDNCRNISGNSATEAGCVVVIFGAYCSQSLHIDRYYYGTGERSFLFQGRGDQVTVYPWTKKNHYFCLCGHDFLGFGGGHGQFGLYAYGDLIHGHSQTCETFDNKVLGVGGMDGWAFDIADLEVWGVGSAWDV